MTPRFEPLAPRIMRGSITLIVSGLNNGVRVKKAFLPFSNKLFGV